MQAEQESLCQVPEVQQGGGLSNLSREADPQTGAHCVHGFW